MIIIVQQELFIKYTKMKTVWIVLWEVHSIQIHADVNVFKTVLAKNQEQNGLTIPIVLAGALIENHVEMVISGTKNIANANV